MFTLEVLTLLRAEPMRRTDLTSTLKNLCVFGRMVYTISLYVLQAHAEYARGTPDVRYSYAGISRDFWNLDYFINFHTLLIRFSHTQ